MIDADSIQNEKLKIQTLRYDRCGKVKDPDIVRILNGHNYFYCKRAKCRLRLEVCIERQRINNGSVTDGNSLFSCKGCSRIRAHCRLHLTVCLQSPKSINHRVTSHRSFFICKNCEQGEENITRSAVKDDRNNRIGDRPRIAYSINKRQSRVKPMGFGKDATHDQMKGVNTGFKATCDPSRIED